jgi:hypothetical protein
MLEASTGATGYGPALTSATTFLVTAALVTAGELDYVTTLQRLLEPNLRITVVAEAVGFNDPAHFSRMFRRLAGLSPRHFRPSDLGALGARTPVAFATRCRQRSSSSVG